jgi:peptidoglycan hydrolase-like protein with peptidoglycan-binding domain
VNVQRKLAILGYADVPQSGQLDAATRSAIRAFQSNSGLPPTGEVDSQTLKLLSSMSRIQ